MFAEVVLVKSRKKHQSVSGSRSIEYGLRRFARFDVMVRAAGIVDRNQSNDEQGEMSHGGVTIIQKEFQCRRQSDGSGRGCDPNVVTIRSCHQLDALGWTELLITSKP